MQGKGYPYPFNTRLHSIKRASINFRYPLVRLPTCRYAPQSFTRIERRIGADQVNRCVGQVSQNG